MAGPAAAATVTAAASAAKRFRLFIVFSLATTGPEYRPRSYEIRRHPQG